jgi:hypothetical protein
MSKLDYKTTVSHASPYNFTKSYPNLQNIPINTKLGKDIRRAMIPIADLMDSLYKQLDSSNDGRKVESPIGE